jgi:hypothetical protein
MKKNKFITYLIVFLVGFALSRFNVIAIYHELIHYFAAWLEGVPARITSDASIRVLYATPFICYSAYYGELITYTTLFFLIVRKHPVGAVFFLGLVTDIAITAPLGTDFNEVAASALQSERLVDTMIIIWSLIGLFIIALMLGTIIQTEIYRRKNHVRQHTRRSKEHLPRTAAAQPNRSAPSYKR